jgi:hypothetical protein
LGQHQSRQSRIAATAIGLCVGLTLVAAPASAEAGGPIERVATAKLIIALAGAVLLTWGGWLAWRGRPRAQGRLRDGLLAALGIVGLLGWWNFLQFHYPSFVHPHELYHYVLGAKFFPELGYRRLYTCTAVADAADGLEERVAARRITDLESYALIDTTAILTHPERCTAHFSEERWALFREDLRWFRERVSAETWEKLQRDHGYNPTPLWGALGGALVGSRPLDDARLSTLLLIDPLLELALWGYVVWAFGWRAACVAALFWGTNLPAGFTWTGGAFLREGWLACSVIGLCLLRLGRPLPAGYLLATAALLRVFPALLLVPLAWQAIAHMGAERRPVLAPELRRVAAGAALALATLVPLSLAFGGGVPAWKEFARNIALHTTVPTINAVGLGTLVSWDADERLARLEETEADPGSAWKQARTGRAAARRPLRAALALGLLALTLWAARREPPWSAAALGVGLIPALLDPSSYYAGIFLVYGLLWTRRPAIGAGLCTLSAFGWLAAAGDRDPEQVLAWVSGAMLAYVAFAAVALVRGPRAAEPPPARSRRRSRSPA